jgi:hypothetical protein
MLSHILHLHPDVLSVSEFFGILRAAEHLGPDDVPVREMDGPEFWGLLARPDPLLDAQICAGLVPPEICYPYGVGRFLPATGVPLICHNLLAGLTGDPDGLFDDLAATVPGWPRRPAVAHYRAFFADLAGRLGKRVVVERSGASLELIPMLRAHFPGARFIYLHRNGPDCALSMSRHPTFRRQILTAAAAYAAGLPLLSPPREIVASLPERFRCLVYPPYDAQAIMTHPIPLSLFGSKIWSPMVLAGAKALSELDPGSWMALNYQDLVDDPARALTRLADFIGVAARMEWIEAAAALVIPGRIGSARAAVDPVAFASLVTACAPGARAVAALVAGQRAAMDRQREHGRDDTHALGFPS